MTDEMKREFLLESIRSSFDAVFQLDLINGVYQPVFSGGVDLSQGTQSYDYADFAESLQRSTQHPARQRACGKHCLLTP